MSDAIGFSYDVFLSHSSKDAPVVRDIAERLKKDGVKVCFDEWVLKPGDSIAAKIEEGLEHSRVLVLCMSANAFGSDWAQLEFHLSRFLDPANHERRLTLLRLDNADIIPALADFNYLVLNTHNDTGYRNLRDSLRPRAQVIAMETGYATGAAGFDSAGRCFFTSTPMSNIRLSKLDDCSWHQNLACDRTEANSLLVHSGLGLVIAGGNDGVLREFSLSDGSLERVIGQHEDRVNSLSLNKDGGMLLSCSSDHSIGLWHLKSAERVWKLGEHDSVVQHAIWLSDDLVASASEITARVWNIKSGKCVKVFKGHYELIEALAFNPELRQLVTASRDRTIRIWDLDSMACLMVLEGHSDSVTSLAVNSKNGLLLSGSDDHHLRLWDLSTGHCDEVLRGHSDRISRVAWGDDLRHVFSSSHDKTVRQWDLGSLLSARAKGWRDQANQASVRYANAKVLLVGESGAGKTGLSKRLVLNDWQPTGSTIGAWATQWKLPVLNDNGVEREIWLWDFGGQADQRLIHQLYMDETALAVLVFDGQRDDLFDTLSQWDRGLSCPSRKDFAKLLVAGRIDAGGLRVSRTDIENFATDRGYGGFIESSAKENVGCDELKNAILSNINWNDIPCRTTQVLFKRLKEELIRLRDEGNVLMRFNELRVTLQLRLPADSERFSDEELHAVLRLLAGPGVVWELAFGSWVLLQPEHINSYAQAVIRTLQADRHQRGCVLEERVLNGELIFESSVKRLQSDEERFVLLAMHQALVERGLCLRQPSAKGNLLVFPSYYRNERPNIVQYPVVQVSYRFTGFLDEIYATLVVRLHHTEPFEQDRLWRYAADFKTNTGKQLGIKLTRHGPGAGELEVYFETAVAIEEKIIFSKYVHEHLLQHARDVERLRHYVCRLCGTPVGNREVAMRRLNDWLRGRSPQSEAKGASKLQKKKETPSIICVECLKQVSLWDEMEQCFASHQIQQRVRGMQEESKIELDNESKERALVGEVISVVANAGQLSREFNVSDHGIDLEIEFKTDPSHGKPGQATGQKLYLQLKSGDSYLNEGKSGKEVFKIKDQRHVEYWMAQAFPVLLVIRRSDGEVRWMEVRDYLIRMSENGTKPVKQIVFVGDRFDVASIRRWREKILGVGH